MQHCLVRVFDVLEHAERARNALLEDGFDADALTLSIVNDEAGPVAGNFAVGNMPIESDRHTYGRNYAGGARVAQCILSVGTTDASRAVRADAILARCGARCVDDPASPRVQALGARQATEE